MDKCIWKQRENTISLTVYYKGKMPKKYAPESKSKRILKSYKQ